MSVYNKNMNRMLVAGGMLVSSSVLAYFAKSPFIFVLGLFAILYFLMFSSQIYTQPAVSLSGDDFQQVEWLGAVQNGVGIYSFQVNKSGGLAIWLSNSASTSKPGYVLFVDDINRGTSLYSYDGQNLGSAPLTSGSFKLNYVQDATRVTPNTLLNVMVYPTAVYLYGASAEQMAVSAAPTSSVPLYQSTDPDDYFVLSYIWTDASSPTCLVNVGFASSADTNGLGGTIYNYQQLPGNVTSVLTSLKIRSHGKGKGNEPDPSENQIVFNESWIMQPAGVGVLSFNLNFINTSDYQSGLVVIASPWPSYQDSVESNPEGTQYYFFFNKESHEFGAGGSNACKTSNWCWEGVAIRQWSSDGSSGGTNLCEAWGAVDKDVNSELYQGWKDCVSSSDGICTKNKCRQQYGKNCLLLDQTSPFDGSQGCCVTATTSAYQEWRKLLWEQKCGTCVQCFVQFSQDSMQMGFIDSQGNAHNLLQQPYSPDPDHPVQYWGFAVTGVGHPGSIPHDTCPDLDKYSDVHARLTLSNISLTLPGAVPCGYVSCSS